MDRDQLFMFECFKCKRRRVVYEDGSECHNELSKCPKCQGDLASDIKHRNSGVLVFTCTCKRCGYKKRGCEG